MQYKPKRDKPKTKRSFLNLAQPLSGEPGHLLNYPTTDKPTLHAGPIPTKALPKKPTHTPTGRPRNPNAGPIPGFLYSEGVHVKPLRGLLLPPKHYPKIKFHS